MSTTEIKAPAYEVILAEIAQKHLGMETLETRNADRLDFHDLSVGAIRAALVDAYMTGVGNGAAAILESLKTC